MIVVWSGKGWLVPLLLIASFGPFMFILSQSERDPTGRSIYFQENWWWMTGLSFIAAGLVNWLLGRYLHRRPGIAAIDPMTGIEGVWRPHHSYYWLKMEHWGVIFAIVGVLFFVAKALITAR